MSEHAILSASSSVRWINCPGSVRLTKDIPSSSSKFARHGSAAHALCERCLRDGSNAEDHQGLQIKIEDDVYEVDEEMVDAVQVYLDFVRSLSGELYVEQRVDYSPWAVKDSFGTADAIVIDWNQRHMTVCDFKFGAGIAVSAVKNSQLGLYALGAINEFGHLGGIDTIQLAIIQPRVGAIK